jgi:hypothetical protein
MSTVTQILAGSTFAATGVSTNATINGDADITLWLNTRGGTGPYKVFLQVSPDGLIWANVGCIEPQVEKMMPKPEPGTSVGWGSSAVESVPIGSLDYLNVRVKGLYARIYCETGTANNVYAWIAN